MPERKTIYINRDLYTEHILRPWYLTGNADPEISYLSADELCQSVFLHGGWVNGDNFACSFLNDRCSIKSSNDDKDKLCCYTFKDGKHLSTDLPEGTVTLLNVYCEQFEIRFGNIWYRIENFGRNEKENCYYGLIRVGNSNVSSPDLIRNHHTVYMWGSDAAEYESKTPPGKDMLRSKRWKIADTVNL